MSDILELRPITADDEAFLKRVYFSTREEELQPVPWSDEQKAEFLGQQFRAQHDFYQQQFPDARFDLVLRYGQPVGRLYVDRREDEIRIIDIALLTEARGKGLGGRLLRELLAEAGEAGKAVRIHVERNNPALRLYHRLGFESIEDQGVYYLMEWRPEAAD